MVVQKLILTETLIGAALIYLTAVCYANVRESCVSTMRATIFFLLIPGGKRTTNFGHEYTVFTFHFLLPAY